MNTTTVKEKDQGFALQSFVGPLVIVASAFAAVIFSVWGTQGDLQHMLGPTQAFASGNFSEMYPEGAAGTSLTGWIAIILIPYLVAKIWLTDLQAFTFAGLVAVPALPYRQTRWVEVGGGFLCTDPIVSLWKPQKLSSISLI